MKFCMTQGCIGPQKIVRFGFSDTWGCLGSDQIPAFLFAEKRMGVSKLRCLRMFGICWCSEMVGLKKIYHKKSSYQIRCFSFFLHGDLQWYPNRYTKKYKKSHTQTRGDESHLYPMVDRIRRKSTKQTIRNTREITTFRLFWANYNNFYT